jgi:RES domain-containing protein
LRRVVAVLRSRRRRVIPDFYPALTGAMLVGGRFSTPCHPVIYGATTLAGAMLEVPVRIGKVPRTRDPICNTTD